MPGKELTEYFTLKEAWKVVRMEKPNYMSDKLVLEGEEDSMKEEKVRLKMTAKSFC